MSRPVVVLIGPSGSGKSSVAKELCEVHGFHLVKTVTTRPQRDEHDTDHLFINEETFEHMLDSEAFFGTLYVFNHSYGLPKFNPSQPTLLLLRAPAIQEFLTKFPDAYIVQIEAPVRILEERLIGRGSADRINKDELVRETALGKLLANKIIDSSTLTLQTIAKLIAENTNAI